MKRWPSCGIHFARSFGDRQRLELDYDRTLIVVLRSTRESDIGDDMSRDGKFGVLQLAGQQLHRGIAVGPDQPEGEQVALTDESQRLQLDRAEIRKQNPIRWPPARVSSARSRPAAAADIGILVTAVLPDKRARVRSFVVADRGYFSNRRRNGGRRQLLVQNGWEPDHFDGEIFPLL